MRKIVCGVVVALLLGLFCSSVWAKHPHIEKYYQQIWCDEHGGVVEVVLSDGSRCDCVTKTNAIEFDFGKKWAESIGQSANYSMQTGLRGGIVLIMEDEADKVHLKRIRDVIDHFKLPIDVWEIPATQQK